jgi:hypothetical protein
VQPFFEDRQRIVLRSVIETEHDDGAHLRPQSARIATPIRVARHPIHVAMAAGFEKCAQTRSRVGNGVGQGYAVCIKAVRAGLLGKRGLGFDWRQKSRLA